MTQKYRVEVVFVFEDVEAEDEEEAISFCESAMKYYVHHPITDEIINPESSADQVNDAVEMPPLVDFLLHPEEKEQK